MDLGFLKSGYLTENFKEARPQSQKNRKYKIVKYIAEAAAGYAFLVWNLQSLAYLHSPSTTKVSFLLWYLFPRVHYLTVRQPPQSSSVINILFGRNV